MLAEQALPPVKLVKRGSAWYTEDGCVRVSRWKEYRNTRKINHFKGYITTYTAIIARPIVLGSDPATYEIARGYKLDELKERLARYYADRAAGTLGPRSRYGFGGDLRPVATF